jgi:hypothetical protein
METLYQPSSFGIRGGQNVIEADFLQVLPFTLLIIIPPIVPYRYTESVVK